MKNIIKKVNLITIILLVLAVSIFTQKSFATDYNTMMTQASDFITKGGEKAEEIGVNPTEMAGNFVGLGQILTMIGMGVLVAVTTYMGIKYLTSGPEGQAKLKQQLIGLVVSAIVVFGAYNIWKIILSIVEQFDN